MLGQQFRIIQERGQSGLFGLLCGRLFCSFFDGLGAIQGEGLCNHGGGCLLVLDGRNVLSGCFLSGFLLSVQLLLSVGNDGSQGGFHIFARLIRGLGRGLGSLRCFGGELFSLLSFGLYGSYTEDRVILVVVLELNFNRRKLSLGRLVRSFNSLLYAFLLLRRSGSGRTSHNGTGSGKTRSGQHARRGTLFSALNYRLFSGFGSSRSLVRSLLLGEFRLKLMLNSFTFSLNRVNALNSGFLRLILQGSLSCLSGRNGLSLDSGASQQEALAGSLTVRSAQVGCVNLQTVAQTGLQGNRRAVPGCAGLLSLGVQCRNGREPVNTGHNNAGFNLTAAVQQTVVHILINLAQFKAHGARTAGAHELREAVESTLLGENGQGCRTLNGFTQDDGFGDQFSLVFAELLLSFL